MSELFEGLINDTLKDPQFLSWKNCENLALPIEEAFKICQPYLDIDFKGQFSQSFFSRLWELYICYTLLNSSAQTFLKATKGKGPDFILEKFCEGTNIYIECVCPQDEDPKIEKGSSIINKNYSRKEEETQHGYVSTSQGYDDFIVSRFSNSISAKAKYFEEKYKDITKGQYRVLCVSGAVMGSLKAKRHSSFDSYLTTEEEFKSAVCPKKYWIEKYRNFESGPIIPEPLTIKIQKGVREPFEVGHQDYLQTFHAIIFSDIVPFNTKAKTSGNIFTIYFNQEAPENFRQAIGKIFY